MSITLRRAHRDVLYAAVVADLSGIGDINAALSQGDVEEARKLRQRFGLSRHAGPSGRFGAVGRRRRKRRPYRRSNRWPNRAAVRPAP